MDEFLEILPKVLIAAGAGLLGGIFALFWSPKVWARSAIQHFAAGAVLAAVASGVIPEAERTGSIFGILAGFAARGAAKRYCLILAKTELGLFHGPIIWNFYLSSQQLVGPN